MFKVTETKLVYTKEPIDEIAYTNKMDKMYTKVAKAYDYFMVFFPPWKKWLGSILPYIKGQRLLEVSFGPAYLLSVYDEQISLHGLDYNETMVKCCIKKMKLLNRDASIIKGNVESMPYPDDYFDTVVNTMAFSGYPNGSKAMEEMLRVLKPDGVLLLLDYDYPINRNIAGYFLVRFIELCGDIIRDIGKIIDECAATYERKTIAGFGSIQLFVIKKP